MVYQAPLLGSGVTGAKNVIRVHYLILHSCYKDKDLKGNAETELRSSGGLTQVGQRRGEGN